MTRSTYGSDVHDYATAAARLGSKDRVRLMNNTYMRRIDAHHIAISLHDTDVITFDATGFVFLNTGGWFTTTTKDRMNRYTDAKVYSRDWAWYVDWHGTTYRYSDVMMLCPDGTAA